MRRVLFALAALCLSAGLANATPITGYSTASLSGAQSYTWAGGASHLDVITDSALGYGFSQPAPTTGLKLAGLSWTESDNNPVDADLTWLVNIYFTDPVGSSLGNSLTLTLNAKKSGMDNIHFEALDPGAIVLAGYDVTNLHYESEAGSFTGSVWNRTSGTDRLFIVADFAATPAASSPAPVPEPASMVLLGTGLLMVGGAARRRLRK